jgi:hypothetical protein
MAQDPLGDVLLLRMNHLQPPFNNLASGAPSWGQ